MFSECNLKGLPEMVNLIHFRKLMLAPIFVNVFPRFALHTGHWTLVLLIR